MGTATPGSLYAALAAAGALLAACAGEPLTPPAEAGYRPAPRSTLVSARDARFVVAQWQQGDASTTLLARQRADATPQPVARLVQVRQGQDWQVAVQQLPADSAAELPGTAIEQLYALVLRLEPQARYCLGQGAQPCDAAREGGTHAEVLQALARQRASQSSPGAVPWRVVDMAGAPTRSWDADVVGVRATGPEGPLEGVAIYFNRAPHSLCIARTRADGVAVCRLEDQFHDGHLHDHATAVVATFPGDVRSDRVLLPTTFVLPQPSATMPPFARPLLR
ncbi:MAG: hypothetical protein U1F56_14030 [Rubrivivax sp.]